MSGWTCFKCSEDNYLKFMSVSLKCQFERLRMAWANLGIEIFTVLMGEKAARRLNFVPYRTCHKCGKFLMKTEDKNE